MSSKNRQRLDPATATRDHGQKADRRPPSPSTGAAAVDRILALQRTIGNRAVGEALGKMGSRRSPVVQRTKKGESEANANRSRLRGVIEEVDAVWRDFDDSSAGIEEEIYKKFLPFLYSFSRAAGVSKTSAGKKMGAPITLADSPRRKEPVELGKDLPPRTESQVDEVGKEAAKVVGRSLVRWAENAVEGAERYYGEMRTMVREHSGPTVFARFGMSNEAESDIVERLPGKSPREDSARAIEVKHVNSKDQGNVDAAIKNGVGQLAKRVEVDFFDPPRPKTENVRESSYTPTRPERKVAVTRHQIYVEINNDRNPWPYTPTELEGLGKVSTADISDRDIVLRALDRNLIDVETTNDALEKNLEAQKRHRPVVVRWRTGTHRSRAQAAAAERRRKATEAAAKEATTDVVGPVKDAGEGSEKKGSDKKGKGRAKKWEKPKEAAEPTRASARIPAANEKKAKKDERDKKSAEDAKKADEAKRQKELDARYEEATKGLIKPSGPMGSYDREIRFLI